MYTKAADGGDAETSGSTLVVADVSRGNVGQLAADLLITTLRMRRVGYFNDPDVLPAIGARPRQHQLLCCCAVPQCSACLSRGGVSIPGAAGWGAA